MAGMFSKNSNPCSQDNSKMSLIVSTFECNFQGFTIIAFAVTDFAGNINIWQKMHFDLNNAIASTILTATTFNIKANRPAHNHGVELQVYPANSSRIGVNSPV